MEEFLEFVNTIFLHELQKFFAYGGAMDEQHEKYERCFIATVFEHAAKKFKTNIQFARALWPEKSDANVSTRIRAIRNQNSRGKPQGLKMCDAANMADVLGVPLSSLALEVETKIRLGWAEVPGSAQLALFVIPDGNEPRKEQKIDARMEEQHLEHEARDKY